MTIAQQSRIVGFQAQLRIRGRDVQTDMRNAQGQFEGLRVLVEDQPQLPDPDQPAQQQQPVYTRVSALAGAIKDPRAVSLFTEVESGRWHKVLRYEETSGDKVKWSWTCEAQRVQ